MSQKRDIHRDRKQITGFQGLGNREMRCNGLMGIGVSVWGDKFWN